MVSVKAVLVVVVVFDDDSVINNALIQVYMGMEWRRWAHERAKFITNKYDW